MEIGTLDGYGAENCDMTFRERIMSTFKKEKIDKVVWQPRIYYWFYGNRLESKLPNGYEDSSVLDAMYRGAPTFDGYVPEGYRDKSMLEIYDDLDASPRYPQEVLGVSLYELEVDGASEIKVRVVTDQQQTTTILETPKGDLREVTRRGYHTEYPVKGPDDMGIMEYVLDNTRFQFNQNAFEIADRDFGERGVVQSFYPRSPLQRLIIDYMGFKNTVLALYRYPDKTEEFLNAIEEWDDRMYRVLLDSPLQVLSFGENIDGFLVSPRLYEEYHVPYYKKRVKQIHQKNKFCHIHMDGSLKPLLPLLDEVEFDGIEAATPKPQGDVNLEELKDAMGGTILLDGIPAVLFLPQYPEKQLEEFAVKVLETFSPNLILGISDELPPDADIERVRLVSEIVKNYEM